MEAIAIIGGIASFVQLIDAALKTSRTLSQIFQDSRTIAKEIRRLSLRIYCVEAKLGVLRNEFADLPEDCAITPSILAGLCATITETQKDLDNVARCIKACGPGGCETYSTKQRLQYLLCNKNALVKCMRYLDSSEGNLARIEQALQMHLLLNIYRRAETLKEASSISDSGKSLAKENRKTVINRMTLLSADSILRKCGFFSSYIWEVGQNLARRNVFRLGVCLPEWLTSSSVSLEVVYSGLGGGWTFQHNVHVEPRVSANSPLMRACRQGDVALIRTLLSQGNGSINDRTSCSGKTPLLMAIKYSHAEAVRFLLQCGANPNIADDDQVPPVFAVGGMDILRSKFFKQLPPTWHCWLDMLRLLAEYRASLDDTVHGRSLGSLNVTRTGSSTTLEFLRLLAAEDCLGPDEFSGAQCWSALQNALRAEDHALDALQVLNSSGIDLLKISKDGRTALHMAGEWSADPKVFDYLCSTGCLRYIDKQDQWGWTPLHYCVSAHESEEKDTSFARARILLSRGANAHISGSVNLITAHDQPVGRFTPLELCEHQRPHLTDRLREVIRNFSVDGAEYGIS